MADLASNLGRKKEAAIVALLSQRSVDEAARTCDVPVRTLYRWLQEPEFQKAYRAARREAFGQATARLQQATGAAATTFLKLMVDPNVPPAVRLRAADCEFNHSAKAIEIEDLDARITELERAAELVKNGHRR